MGNTPTLNQCKFSFFVGQPPEPVSDASPQWQAALPSHRHDLSTAATATADAAAYGDYFTATADFLSRDDLVLARQIVARVTGTDAASIAPTAVAIHLIKHGAFYHPALVTLSTAGGDVQAVLNVAASEAGRQRLPHEAAHLARLTDDFPEHHLPRLYAIGTGRTDRGGRMPMFAAEWFDGYHELHRTGTGTPSIQRWSVWDTDNGTWQMAGEAADPFFRQAAYILAYYFDPRTLSAIQSWHHAAGDFVVAKQGDGIQVRLITVRRFGPVVDPGDGALDLQTLLDALTVHLVHVSLWLRIDRIDGVGDLVWAHDRYLAPICQGFLQGVAQMAALNGLPEEFIQGVVEYLCVHPPEAFHAIGMQLLPQLPEALPEAALIRENLAAHCEGVSTLLNKGLT